MNPRDASCVWKNIEVEDGQAFFTNDQMTENYLYCKTSRYQRWQEICLEYPNLKAQTLNQLQQQGNIGPFTLIDDRPDHLVAAVKLIGAFCFKVNLKRTLLAVAIKQSIPKHPIKKTNLSAVRIASKR